MNIVEMLEAASELEYLWSIAILLLAATIGGYLSSLIKMPAVLGQIVAGIVVGPTLLGLVDGDKELIRAMSEIGVIFLMFLAGLETDLKQLKATGKSATLIAAGGVIVPIILGTLIPLLFFTGFLPTGDNMFKFMSALYIGTVLTATSVSISVSVLRDMNKLSSRQGVAILSAAIIDDVFGIILLAVVSGMVNPGEGANPIELVIRIILFFILAFVVGYILSKVFTKFAQKKAWKDSIILIAIVMCFIFSYISEMFSVAAITGAYVAGVIIATTPYRRKVVSGIEEIAFSLFTPIFFAGIGLSAHITGDIVHYLWYAIVLFVIAIVSKLLGCGLVARVSGFTSKQSMQIGVGMIARAEVALIVAMQGLSRGYVTEQTFTSIVLVVLLTTLVTPPFLKLSFKGDKSEGATVTSN